MKQEKLNEQEIWKDVNGYQGRYQVSNLGNIKSIRKNKILSLIQSPVDYLQCSLWDGKKGHTVLVHRLVAMAFIDGYTPGLEVNHKDLNKQNNRADNLEWVTHSQNAYHQYHHYHKEINKDNNPEYFCIDCGKKLSNKKHIRCRECNLNYSVFRQAKQNGLNRDVLKKLIRKKSFRELGRIYGVADNTIKKWCKYFNLPTHKREINNYSNKEWEKI